MRSFQLYGNMGVFTMNSYTMLQSLKGKSKNVNAPINAKVHARYLFNNLGLCCSTATTWACACISYLSALNSCSIFYKVGTTRNSSSLNLVIVLYVASINFFPPKYNAVPPAIPKTIFFINEDVKGLSRIDFKMPHFFSLTSFYIFCCGVRRTAARLGCF